MGIEDHWPLFGLRIITPRLELRYPTDSDIAELAELAAKGVHDPEMMPFTTPWTEHASPVLERNSLQHWWRMRAELTPTNWCLGMAVVSDGALVGLQNISAKDFPTVRNAETGSWLGINHHGQGIGKEMRAAIVHFTFEYLKAEAVTSSAFLDNIASQRVSEAIGYEPNGTAYAERRGERGEQILYLLTRKRWTETRTDMAIEVRGFEPCRPLLGLEQDAELDR